jgi:diaminopimelate epimerase
MTPRLPIVKAHAYGNDFLLVPETEAALAVLLAAAAPATGIPYGELARAACDRYHGIGADGLILYTLHNQGSAAELSGNGLRCLAALVVRMRAPAEGSSLAVDTDAGVKTLELLVREGERYTFRAAMGMPEDLRQVSIEAGGESVTASILRLGNPQCVVLGPLPDADRFDRLGPALASHPMFPAGTNVAFAEVEARDRVRILIWERGVGPTASSGTGTSASAIAAAAHGGAGKTLDVVAPGGTQRVEWREDSVYLTGWAELIMTGEWLTPGPIRRTP